MIASRLRNFCIIFLLSFIVSGCNDDEAGSEPLLRVIIPPDGIDESEHLWVFLSDSEGNNLGVKQAINDTELKFDRPPGFTAERFTMTIFRKSTQGATTSREFYTYSSIKPMVMKLASLPQPEPQGHKGFVSVSVNNVPEGYLTEVTGDDVMSLIKAYEVGDVSFSLSATVIDEIDVFILSYHPVTGNAKGKLLKGVDVGSTTNIDFDDLTDLNVNTMDIPGADNNYVSQYAYENTTESGPSFFIHFHIADNDGGPNEVMRFYKPADFNFYKVYGTVIDDNIQYTNSLEGQNPPSQFTKLDVNLTSWEFSDDAIEMSIDGSADVMFTGGYMWKSNGTTATSDMDVVFLPVTDIMFKTPEIPGQILSTYFPEGYEKPSIQSLSVNEYSAATSYDDYMEVTWDEVFDRIDAGQTSNKTYTLDSNSGGRSRQQSQRHDLKLPFRITRVTE